MLYRLQKNQIADSKKSILLLGPRQVGKSTLIKGLNLDIKINFAEEKMLLEYAANPSMLNDLIERKKANTVFIDEVQRLPSILNTIQSLIDDNKKLKFYLTGSSARKLKRGGANLLPGRVINYLMGPITAKELDYKFNIQHALRFGFLPEILTLKDDSVKKDILLSYSSNYVREEIQAEALTKSLESFSRFLSEISKSVGQFIDYTKISKKIKISRHTCPNFFEILEDTMVGHRIFPDAELIESIDLIKHPKFYFFDIGVFNGLEKNFEISNSRSGLLSEQLVFQQIQSTANALKKKFSIHSFRTRGGLEVDFLVYLEKDSYLIEVKYSDNLHEDDVASLISAKKYLPAATPFLFHAGKKSFKIQNIWALPIAEGLREIGL